MAQRLTIAIDTGGTFTDCVYRRDGRVEVLKLPSTPGDPGRAIVEAVEQVLRMVGAKRSTSKIEVRHGTTVATNALLERKGARVAFVTTQGFEDTLAIGRQARPSLYDWNAHRPEPLAVDGCCFGIAERVATDGSVLLAPDEEELSRLRESIAACGAEAVALSLLFAFAHPAHEQAVATALRPLGLPVSLSHQILPEFREYERAATVTLNAYLAPKMQSYLGRLATELAERGARLSIMQSSGGILPAESAAREPVRTILSGPAGGVIGALSVARAAGVKRVLSFDMGGTSTDVALLDATRELAMSTEGQVAGLPVGVPILDIHTAGAGGGSLAWFDTARELRVGPASAGAEPGPACYGTGDRPTVTDANLVLGRLHAEHFLAGAKQLDLARAREVLERSRGSFASVEAFAEGIVTVANAHMESALRRVSVERGHDPKQFSLLAFGGAGPLHACALAAGLGIREVLVPNAPGALSALGILDADLRREFSRTVMTAPNDPKIDEVFRQLEAEARQSFAEEGRRPRLTRWADMRYAGQGFELRVAWGKDAEKRFHAQHRQAYGYADDARVVQVVTVRVTALAVTRKFDAPASALQKTGKGDARQAFVGAHRIFASGRWRRAGLFQRDRLQPGDSFRGPAVVVELSATTYVAAGWLANVDELGNLRLRPDGSDEA